MNSIEIDVVYLCTDIIKIIDKILPNEPQNSEAHAELKQILAESSVSELKPRLLSKYEWIFA